MFNLNDASFDAKTVAIFNNGEAGLVRNVKLSKIEPKTDANSNGPDYKIFFQDGAGNEMNMGLWYLDQSKDTFAKDLEKQGKTLKHLVHCFCGENFSIPAFNSTKELLDGCLNLIQSKAGSMMVRLYCTYGTTQYPKKYLQVRGYVPFIEPESVPVSETRLKPSNIDQLTRIEEDAPSAGSYTADSDVI
jgi:hypothetical protein